MHPCKGKELDLTQRRKKRAWLSPMRGKGAWPISMGGKAAWPGPDPEVEVCGPNLLGNGLQPDWTCSAGLGVWEFVGEGVWLH